MLPRASPGVQYKLDVLENPQAARFYDQCSAPANPLHLDPHALPFYPGASTGAREELRAQLARDFGADVILTHGSDEALRLIFATFARDDSYFVVPTPTYPHALHFMDEFARTRRVTVPISASENDTDLITAQIDSVMCAHDSAGGVLYLANPNMPLGWTLRAHHIAHLAREHPRFIIALDEAYCEFRADALECIDCARAIAPPSAMHIQDARAILQECANVIVTRTFSKFYGLASMRIGYIVAQQEVARLLLRMYNEKSVTEPAASLALHALSQPHVARELLREFAHEREFIRATLTELRAHTNWRFDFSIRDGNFYLLFVPNAEKFARDLRIAYGIQVRDKSADIANALRIGIQDRETNEIVLAACRALLNVA